MFRLVKLKLRIEYAVISSVHPVEEARELEIAGVKYVQDQPNGATQTKILCGLEKTVDTNQYILNRKLPDLQFSFDDDDHSAMLGGNLKVSITTRDDQGEQYVDTAFYPISRDNDTPFTDDTTLDGVILYAYLLQEITPAGPQITLVYVDAEGGGVHDACIGCHEQPSREKRIDCALDGCYATG